MKNMSIIKGMIFMFSLIFIIGGFWIMPKTWTKSLKNFNGQWKIFGPEFPTGNRGEKLKVGFQRTPGSLAQKAQRNQSGFQTRYWKNRGPCTRNLVPKTGLPERGEWARPCRGTRRAAKLWPDGYEQAVARISTVQPWLNLQNYPDMARISRFYKGFLKFKKERNRFWNRPFELQEIDYPCLRQGRNVFKFHYSQRKRM